jgi:Tfp pilus assembly pilus retraction ATPase PilT
MYSMEHLVALMTAEKAQELRCCAGQPPLIVSEQEQRALQGPPIGDREVEQLLRSVANSRQMRELRDCRRVQFVYTLRGRTPVLVRAKIEDENIVFDIS